MEISFSQDFKGTVLSSTASIKKTDVTWTPNSLYVMFIVYKLLDLLFIFCVLKFQNQLSWYGSF